MVARRSQRASAGGVAPQPPRRVCPTRIIRRPSDDCVHSLRRDQQWRRCVCCPLLPARYLTCCCGFSCGRCNVGKSMLPCVGVLLEPLCLCCGGVCHRALFTALVSSRSSALGPSAFVAAGGRRTGTRELIKRDRYLVALAAHARMLRRGGFCRGGFFVWIRYSRADSRGPLVLAVGTVVLPPLRPLMRLKTCALLLCASCATCWAWTGGRVCSGGVTCC